MIGRVWCGGIRPFWRHTCLPFPNPGKGPIRMLSTSFQSPQSNMQNTSNRIQFLEEKGIKPSVQLYTKMITELTNSGRMDDAESYLIQMRRKGVTPNAVTYTCLIKGYCQARNMKKALEIYEVMRKEGLMDQYTCGTLMNGFVKLNTLEEAENFLAKMQQEGLGLDAFSYNPLINGYVNLGNMGKAYEVFELMRKHRVTPDTASYNTMIKGYIKIDKIEKAENLFKMMREHGIIPNQVSCTTLINGHVKLGNMKKAEELFEQMKKDRIAPTVEICISVIAGFRKKGDMKHALQYFRDIIQLKSDLDLDSLLRILLGGNLEKQGNAEKIIQVFEETQEPNSIFCEEVMNFLVYGFCKIGFMEGAGKMLEVMLKMKLYPNNTAVCEMITSYVGKNNVKKALQLLEQLVVYGVEPNSSHYKILQYMYLTC